MAEPFFDHPYLSGHHAPIRFEADAPDLIIEGIRPSRVVRVRPGAWPQVQVPREEYLNDGNDMEERFPTPAIFPKY